MTNLEQLTHKQQISHLRRVAVDALKQYPTQIERLRIVQLGYNASFKVTNTAGKHFALRVNVNSHRSPANLAAEVAWLRSLAVEGEVVVPVPVANCEGDFVSQVHSTALGRFFSVVLFEWIDGKTLGTEIKSARARQVGRLMAHLHEHGSRFELPPVAELARIDDVLWNLPERLSGNSALLGDSGCDIVENARDSIKRELSAMYASGVTQILHTDLHGWNTIALPGRVAAIDFDDCAIGLPVQDIGVSAYYVDDFDRYLEELCEGYSEVLAVPEFSNDELHAMLAQRNLILLNDLVTTQTAELKAMLPSYVGKTLVRLQRYLDTGRYSHAITSD